MLLLLVEVDVSKFASVTTSPVYKNNFKS